MLSLDENETEIVLMTLQHFEWRAEAQLDHTRANNAVHAAWYATRYCLARVRELIVRIEERQKDEAEEKADQKDEAEEKAE